MPLLQRPPEAKLSKAMPPLKTGQCDAAPTPLGGKTEGGDAAPTPFGGKTDQGEAASPRPFGCTTEEAEAAPPAIPLNDRERVASESAL